jgi:hypothetical protein
MAASGLAHAGGQSGSIGVGAEFQLSGIGGASLTYDAGDFHVGGLIGFGDNVPMSANYFEVGARFFYHLHSTAMADFGIGGNLGVASVDVMGMADRATLVYLEPGVQIRLFLAANVALSFTTGVSIGTIDADGVTISGQNTGVNFAGGIHYYFF